MWDHLDLAYPPPDHTLAGHGRRANARRCAARTHPYAEAMREIETLGTGAPRVHATLLALGQEHHRRHTHWLTRRVSQDHPPGPALLIGLVGLILPVVLLGVVASDPGQGVQDLRGWPMALMALPIALPSALLTLRALARGDRRGVAVGMGLVLAAGGVLVLVREVDALAVARWWAALAISSAVGLAGIVVIVQAMRQDADTSTPRIPACLQKRRCPDCALNLDTTPPAIKPQLLNNIDIGPNACPRCDCAWPLVPPPAGLADRDMPESQSHHDDPPRPVLPNPHLLPGGNGRSPVTRAINPLPR